jgi:two-component sensor histidine kinase
VTRAVYINGVKQQLKSTYQLNYFDNISLCFDGLNYRSNGDFDFAYRIIGSSNSWTMVPGKIEKIDFANLPSGYNSIEIKLIDHSSNDSYNTITLGFNVIPPFWQRWWFYLLITFSTLALAFGIFRWRLFALRKKQFKELKRLRLENELRLTQQNALKAQMNPHFLFNVLNSIKGYIYENDKKNAAKYLSDFSSLVRKVLELSSMPYVSLDQELEALKIYIELEAMLLQSTFSYDLIIDEELDIDDFQVPSLILQPYVENAFKHGLRHKKGNKNLKINLKYNSLQNFLEIQITDNGIGREASEILNKENNNEHKSFATSAIEKRIKLLNYRRKDVVGVEITDNFEGEESIGTTVTIRIHV